MAYPKEFCGLKVHGESPDIQVVSWRGDLRVINLRTGLSLRVGDAIVCGRHDDCDYIYTDAEMAMLRELYNKRSQLMSA